MRGLLQGVHSILEFMSTQTNAFKLSDPDQVHEVQPSFQHCELSLEAQTSLRQLTVGNPTGVGNEPRPQTQCNDVDAADRGSADTFLLLPATAHSTSIVVTPTDGFPDNFSNALRGFPSKLFTLGPPNISARLLFV